MTEAHPPLEIIRNKSLCSIFLLGLGVITKCLELCYFNRFKIISILV